MLEIHGNGMIGMHILGARAPSTRRYDGSMALTRRYDTTDIPLERAYIQPPCLEVPKSIGHMTGMCWDVMQSLLHIPRDNYRIAPHAMATIHGQETKTVIMNKLTFRRSWAAGCRLHEHFCGGGTCCCAEASAYWPLTVELIRT